MQRETWLLTGGAGYIGTHIADEFIRAGKSVVIYDSLYQGLESRIVYLRTHHGVEIPFIKADIRDYNEIENVIRTHKIDGIVHTAALKAVGESMEKSDEYFQVNLEATNELIEIAKRNGVKKFIFSSTAAVYGSPDSMDPCREDGPTAPISPYGSSKLMAENKVTEFISIPGNHGSSLRFFILTIPKQ
jgi:UDP-glucose 4-epimerase